MEIVQYLGTFLGVVSAILVANFPKHIRLGFAINLLSDVLVLVWGVSTGAIGIAASQACYGVLAIIGIYKWKQVRVKEV